VPVMSRKVHASSLLREGNLPAGLHPRFTHRAKSLFEGGDDRRHQNGPASKYAPSRDMARAFEVHALKRGGARRRGVRPERRKYWSGRP